LGCQGIARSFPFLHFDAGLVSSCPFSRLSDLLPPNSVFFPWFFRSFSRPSLRELSSLLCPLEAIRSGLGFLCFFFFNRFVLIFVLPVSSALHSKHRLLFVGDNVVCHFFLSFPPALTFKLSPVSATNLPRRKPPTPFFLFVCPFFTFAKYLVPLFTLSRLQLKRSLHFLWIPLGCFCFPFSLFLSPPLITGSVFSNFQIWFCRLFPRWVVRA